MVEFKKFGQSYENIHAKNIKISGFEPSYFDEYKIRELWRNSANKRIGEIKLLNFGCGIGKSEGYIKKYFPDSSIYSIDVCEESIRIATERNKHFDKIQFKLFDGINIPFELKFDIIFIANVLHHVPRNQHVSILNNVHDSLNPNGLLFLFEHNPYNPITAITVKACEFDKGCIMLNPFYAYKILKKSGFQQQQLKFVVFFPKALSCFLPLERHLSKIPFGAQYHILAEK